MQNMMSSKNKILLLSSLLSFSALTFFLTHTHTHTKCSNLKVTQKEQKKKKYPGSLRGFKKYENWGNIDYFFKIKSFFEPTNLSSVLNTLNTDHIY